MRAVTKIQFTDDEGNKFFGEGPLRLLRWVRGKPRFASACFRSLMALE